MHTDLIIKELYQLNPALKIDETIFSKNNLSKRISSQSKFHKSFYQFSHIFLYISVIQIFIIKYTVAFIQDIRASIFCHLNSSGKIRRTHDSIIHTWGEARYETTEDYFGIKSASRWSQLCAVSLKNKQTNEKPKINNKQPTNKTPKPQTTSTKPTLSSGKACFKLLLTPSH